jgi:hypothetical protein
MINLRQGLKSESGIIIISVLFGLGLAAVFRKACNDKSCIVIKGPNIQEIDDFYYKIHDDCYKYSPVVSECNL